METKNQNNQSSFVTDMGTKTLLVSLCQQEKGICYLQKTVRFCEIKEWLKKLIMSIFSLPSDLEIWSSVLTNFWPPFMYVCDIVKDTVQLLLMIIVVGGYENVFKYWSSFSSVVSRFWQDNFQMNSYQISANRFLPWIVPPFNIFWDNYSIYEAKNCHNT